MTSLQRIYRVCSLLLPLLLAPVLGYLIAEDFISLGGGEKDIVWLLPWILWALLLPVAGVVCWKRHAGYLAWLGRSAVYSLGGLVLIWAGLLIYSLAST